MSWLDRAAGLEGLDRATRARLERLVPMKLPAGSVLFQPGDSARGYLVVLEGRVSVHLVGPTGREILLYDVGVGQTCIQTTLGLLGNEDYSAEAVADTDIEAVLIPRALFLELLDADPAVRRAVFAAFAARMQSVMHILENVAFLKVEARLARHLLNRAGDEGVIEATQAELARAVGSAREVMSRRLDAMERRGLIARERGHIRLADRAGLARIAEEAGV